MHAQYLADGTVQVVLAEGETLGIVTGPETMILRPLPGLSVYDEMVERGIAISPYVPSSCTKLGLVRALREQGTWASIKAVIAADAEAQEEWDLATELRRADPIVQRMIVAAGLSDAQVDALLIRANELV